MNTKEGYTFLVTEDGIYFGKPLENGNISEDSVKINDNDIVHLFLNYFKRYCEATGKNILEIANENNEVVMKCLLHGVAFK